MSLKTVAVREEVDNKGLATRTSLSEETTARPRTVKGLDGEGGKVTEDDEAAGDRDACREDVADGSTVVRKKGKKAAKTVRHKWSTRTKLDLANLGESP